MNVPVAESPVFSFARRLPASTHETSESSPWVAWLTALAATTALLVGLPAARVMKACGRSKLDIARISATHYATEAYARFRMAHPERECPASLDDLNAWTDARTILDPWGTAYRMVCAGDHLRVRSAGEDRMFDTADDVWSGA